MNNYEPFDEIAKRLPGIKELIQKAREGNLWLYGIVFGDDILFSPDELVKQMEQGCFRWGVINWDLVDPNEELSKYKLRLKKVEEQIFNLENRINNSKAQKEE